MRNISKRLLMKPGILSALACSAAMRDGIGIMKGYIKQVLFGNLTIKRLDSGFNNRIYF